jgi:hypothetical protein
MCPSRTNAFDALDVGSGEEVEHLRGQAREQLRCGALTVSNSGSIQSWHELTLGCALVKQVDVGGFGPAVLETAIAVR